MTINSLSGVGGLQQSQNIRNVSSKLQAVISSIVSGQANGDVADLSIASQLQAQVSTLKQASSNISQASSLTQVANGGVEQIQNALLQLQSLAQQAASPILSDANRAGLNNQFNQILGGINQIAGTTSFNGQNLLDGSLSGGNALSLDSLLGGASGADSLSIDNLSTGSLLSNAGDLLSADDAGQALNAINNALNDITGVRASIGSFQQTLDFASANIDSAINNQEAANSALSETDIAAASTQKAEDEVQQNASIALLAQGNKLTPALLKLIS